MILQSLYKATKSSVCSWDLLCCWISFCFAGCI